MQNIHLQNNSYNKHISKGETSTLKANDFYFLFV